MRLPGPFYIDGKSYSPGDLNVFCKESLSSSFIPEWKKEVLEFISIFLDRENHPIRQFSSGTTGDPKRYLLNRESMIRSSQKTLKFFKLNRGDRVLLCLPVKYIAGKMMIVRALVGGLDLIMVQPSSRPMKDFSGSSLSFAAMVPLQVHESLENNDELSSIKTLLIGGGEIHPSKRIQLSRRKNPEVFESFATTETYTHFALRRLDKKGSPFLGLDNVSLSLDERGCLEVDIPGVTDGKVITGDLAEITEDGLGFHWLGRADNMINSGGIKILPEILEQRIGEILGMDCLIISEKDVRLGEKLVLFVETGDPSPPVMEWEQSIQTQLRKYEIPGRIIPVKNIPRNNSFKFDRIAAAKLL